MLGLVCAELFSMVLVRASHQITFSYEDGSTVSYGGVQRGMMEDSYLALIGSTDQLTNNIAIARDYGPTQLTCKIDGKEVKVLVKKFTMPSKV
jgi:hypothetical protein